MPTASRTPVRKPLPPEFRKPATVDQETGEIMSGAAGAAAESLREYQTRSKPLPKLVAPEPAGGRAVWAWGLGVVACLIAGVAGVTVYFAR